MVRTTENESHKYDSYLQSSLKHAFEQADPSVEKNIRCLESVTRHRDRFLHGLLKDEKAVLEMKEQGFSVEAIADQLQTPVDNILQLEKNLLDRIRWTRPHSHAIRKIPISLFYNAEDIAAAYREFEQSTPPGKRPVITYEELRASAEKINLTTEPEFKAFIRYLHSEGCIMYGPDNNELRLIPEKESIFQEDRNGNLKLCCEIGKWDLRVDIVIQWNESAAKNEYDACHQALYRKYLKKDAFLETVYTMRKTGLNGIQMSEVLNKEPAEVYTAETQIWHLYKATFPIEEDRYITRIALEEYREIDENLAYWISAFFPPLNPSSKSNIIALEDSTNHRYHLLHRLREDTKAILELKEQGYSAEVIAVILQEPIDNILRLEKNIRDIILKTRNSHTKRIRDFYLNDTPVWINSFCDRLRGKRYMISYEKLQFAAEQCHAQENQIKELLDRLYRDGHIVLAPGGELRMLPDEEPIAYYSYQEEKHELYGDYRKWDLRITVVIQWNDADPVNEYDAQHKAVFRKHLKKDPFLDTIYSMHKQGMDGMQIAEKLARDPADVYTGECQIWHLYKASFPVE